MNDITALAQRMKAAAEKAIADEGQTWWSEEQLASDYGLSLHPADAKFIALASHENVKALVEALEKAQEITAAAEKLVRCKGRYHSEQNYRHWRRYLVLRLLTCRNWNQSPAPSP